MSDKKYDVELWVYEYQALLDNLIISLMFKDSLQSPKKTGEFVTLRMSKNRLDELVCCVAAEANHAKTNEEEELLGSAYENLDVALSKIKRWER